MAPLSENGSPSMIQGAQILALLQEMEQTKITNYSQLAAITFLVYDILLNFHKEVEYVWMYVTQVYSKSHLASFQDSSFIPEWSVHYCTVL